jgi:oxygen-independent coproporphyrinogen-3 oxidase
MTASLYVHIPFCVRKCAYCDFASYEGKESLFEPYVRALRTQIRRAAEHFADTRIPTVYFGGGTPNVLPPELLASILDEIRRCFHVDGDAEVSIEANPGVTPHPRPLSLRGRGEWFNRLSLGVQSLSDGELGRLGRVHTADQAVEAFHEAREAGFDNLSVDLMYGIPGQTQESWRESLDRVIDLGPEHVSLYSLTVEEGTPFHRMQCEGRLELPGNDIEAEMYEDAIETLTAAGFEHYEISNFARPGLECWHNITYWRNEPYLGFGAAATSYIDGTRATSVADLEEYIRRVGAHESAAESEERLTGRKAMGETMFLGLRMIQGIPEVNRQDAKYAKGIEIFGPEIDRLIERGLLERADGSLRLTRRGLFLANDVFAEFV